MSMPLQVDSLSDFKRRHLAERERTGLKTTIGFEAEQFENAS